MKKLRIRKWILRALKEMIYLEGLDMRKPLNYGEIQKIIKALREKGMSDKAIKNVLDFYN